MKSKLNYKHFILIAICILSTTLSFVLYFTNDNLGKEIIIIIDVLDFILLSFNAFYLSKLIDNDKRKIVLNTILFVLGYLLLFLCIGSYIIGDKMNLEILFTIFQLALFVGPVLLLALPLIYLILLVIGG